MQFKGFTLIELLVVVALIGILSAIGIFMFGGQTKAAKQKNAELSLNTINLAQQEYRSNFGSYYYYPSCSSDSAKNIAANLLDGMDNLSEQDFQFCISGSGSNYLIKAYNPSSGCQITLNEKLTLNRNSNC